MWKIFAIFRKPTPMCAECGQSLALCAGTYKDGESEFCGRRCLEVRRLKRSAGMQSSWLIGAVLLSIFIVCFAVTPKARAQQHHSPFHDFYKEWRQNKPNHNSSCCNARFNEKGEEVGDCERTEFFLRKNEKGELQYYAYVPMVKKILPVPWEKIIKEKNPDESGRDGHVCYSLVNGFLCAVPPTGSM